MDHEHLQPATTRRTALSVSPAGTQTTDAGPVPADTDEDPWLEGELEYAELGGEG